ncbi:3-carboxy-cis%2Ccis-muconate cycloisomerase [uncultured Roseburia sp.]|uniref:Adenylosuccinate lyase family protein n=1 Tax=Brotonthovivens ammoniilytica TaxID=2981725 RepID=A0ABT2TJD2_9FIRM|nr:adenylosuccinate lyase family protein [Brotonthovivens ammoniilytica]MCU6762324.1 adenylosuccinate lyase family protein [Brotonthovivens ammoniilytica]SCI68010.1 3-carboxy-cis%2Ccis-muconate cycloisomerase [uncultured Roseburia sp.]
MEKMLSKMQNILSREGLFTRWLKVEKALASAQAKLGIIPEQMAGEIADHAGIEHLQMEKYDEIYEKTGHPMVSVLRLLEEAIDGPAGQFIHLGATTQDIIDTAMVLAVKETLDLGENTLVNMINATCKMARKYADTPMMGRTHNMQALPITFGYKAAVWASELYRCLERLRESRKRVLALQMSGAVGSMVSFGKFGEKIQELMAEELGLQIPDICWHASRDRYGEFAAQMGLMGTCLGRIAGEIYSLMGTEYGELSEVWGKDRVGSSTMPHKVNPTNTQHILAKASHLRYASAEIMEFMMVDHERNMQHFIGERTKMEQICLYTAEIMDRSCELLDTLVVNEENMFHNLNRLGGLTQSEHVMLVLGEKIGKQNAHKIVGNIAVTAIYQHQNFAKELCKVREVAEVLSKEEIYDLLDPVKYIGDCPKFAVRTADELLRKLEN